MNHISFSLIVPCMLELVQTIRFPIWTIVFISSRSKMVSLFLSLMAVTRIKQLSSRLLQKCTDPACNLIYIFHVNELYGGDVKRTQNTSSLYKLINSNRQKINVYF